MVGVGLEKVKEFGIGVVGKGWAGDQIEMNNGVIKELSEHS